MWKWYSNREEKWIIDNSSNDDIINTIFTFSSEGISFLVMLFLKVQWQSWNWLILKWHVWIIMNYIHIQYLWTALKLDKPKSQPNGVFCISLKSKMDKSEWLGLLLTTGIVPAEWSLVSIYWCDKVLISSIFKYFYHGQMTFSI